MSEGQESPGEVKIEGADQLEKMLYHTKAASRHMREGDYFAAAFILDNFPEGYNKSALYAGIALGVAAQLDKVESDKDGSHSHEAEALKQILGYFQGKCEYFGSQPAGE